MLSNDTFIHLSEDELRTDFSWGRVGKTPCEKGPSLVLLKVQNLPKGVGHTCSHVQMIQIIMFQINAIEQALFFTL